MFLEFLPDCNHSREYKEEKDNILISRSLKSRKEVYNHIHYVNYVFSPGKQLPGQPVAVHLQLTEEGTNQDKPVPQAPSAQPAAPVLGQHCRQVAGKENATPGCAFHLLPLLSRSAQRTEFTGFE